MKFFLVTTDHLKDRIWFRDNEDFRVAMNYVAILSYTLGVNVLAFILMSNHVHFVFQCESPLAKQFIDRFKMLYGTYYKRKYGTSEFLRKVKVDIRELRIEDESLQRGIAYVAMNSVAANICPYPYMYQWGTGNCFFNLSSESFSLLGSISVRAQIKLLKSNVKLPDSYKVGVDGYILPSSYIKVKFVESLFRTSNSYRYFLNNSSKARKHLDSNAAPSFSDQIITAAAKELCRSLFRSAGIEQLQTSQKAELIKQLKMRFSADINQLCRVTGISYKETVSLLEYI
ncbi:MAG: hypothetical protein J5737_05060 [Bacteroidales bacterium]|nr:hypothetical protein [Bacteroidales bacterium]